LQDVTIIIPSGTAIGKTVDAKIDSAPGPVTFLNKQVLRIEPDDVCTIVSVIPEDGAMTIHALAPRKSGGRVPV